MQEKKEMLNDTNYFPLINMIDCQALTLRGEGEKCVKGKFAQTSWAAAESMGVIS